MINHFIFLISLLTSLVLAPFSGFSHLIQTEEDLEQQAVRFIELLNQGKFEEAYESFDDPMRDAIDQERLQAIWTDVISKFGEYQMTGPIRVEELDQYTAVIVETQFERGVLNIRVVFSNTGQISGFFYAPLRSTNPTSPGMILAMAFTALFTILFPILLGIITRRRFAVSWKYFFYGMAIFIIFQLVTRIPIISVIEGMFGSQLRSTSWLLAGWIIFLSFTAGLFEETGRYVGYRWLMNRDPKTWSVGVMYGLGHGGIESMVLVGINSLATLAVLLFYPAVEAMLPQEVGGLLAQQVAVLGSSPDWLPLLAAWERLWTIPVHVALSVIVLQVFRRGAIKWLWLAIAFHTLVNLFVVGLAILVPLRPTEQPLLSSIPVAIAGLLAVWMIWRLRDREQNI